MSQADISERLGKWVHPKTGQKRIYFNTLPGQSSAKVWAEKTEIDSFGSDFTIRISSQSHTLSEAWNLSNEAESLLNELAGKRVNLFSEIEELLEA